jgi:acetylornithine/N-succinyldiaminopimelate aminotransferase
VALAVSREILGRGFLRRVRESGSYLIDSLKQLASRHRCPEVRGKGLLAAMRLPAANAETIRDRCFERGLILNAPRADLLRFMPALNVSRGEIDAVVVELDRALAETGSAHFNGPLLDSPGMFPPCSVCIPEVDNS